MSKVLRKERFYNVAPEVVWEALTTPAALTEWLMPNSFEPRVGAKFEFRTDPTPICGSGITRCEVREMEPCRRMVWTWLRDARDGSGMTPPMTITWTLVPEGSGTRLLLEQTGFEHHGLLVRFLMSIGWSMMLKRSLSKVIANIRAQGAGYWFEPDAIPLAKRYYRCKSVPAGFMHRPVGGRT